MVIYNKDTSNPDNIEIMEHAKGPLSSHAVLDDVRELVRLYDSLMGNEILRHACKNEYQLHEYNKFKFLFEKVRAHVV